MTPMTPMMPQMMTLPAGPEPAEVHNAIMLTVLLYGKLIDQQDKMIRFLQTQLKLAQEQLKAVKSEHDQKNGQGLAGGQREQQASEQGRPDAPGSGSPAS